MRHPKHDEIRIKWDAESAFKRIDLETANAKAFGRTAPDTETMKQAYEPPAAVKTYLKDREHSVRKPQRNIAALTEAMNRKGLTEDDALRMKFGDKPKNTVMAKKDQVAGAPGVYPRWISQYTSKGTLYAIVRIDTPNHNTALAFWGNGQSTGQCADNTRDWVKGANENEQGCDWVQDETAADCLRKLGHPTVADDLLKNNEDKEDKPPYGHPSKTRWGIIGAVLFRFDPEPEPRRSAYYLGRHYYPGKAGFNNCSTFVTAKGANMTPEYSHPHLKKISESAAMLWLLENGYEQEVFDRMPVMAWRTKNENIVRISIPNRKSKVLAYWVHDHDKGAWGDHSTTYPNLRNTLRMISCYEERGVWRLLDEDATKSMTEDLKKYADRRDI